MCITTSKNEQVDAFDIILMNAIWKHFFKKTFEQFIQVNRDLYTVLNKFSGFYSNDFISRKTTCLKKTPKAMFYIKRLLSGKKSMTRQNIYMQHTKVEHKSETKWYIILFLKYPGGRNIKGTWV